MTDFGFLKMGLEVLNLSFVTSFRLRQELAVELLDLRNLFWNEGI